MTSNAKHSGALRGRGKVKGFDPVRPVRTIAATLVTLVKHGPRSAYHQYCEHRAMRRHLRADVEPHLAARINLVARHKGMPLNAFFEIASCNDVRTLTYEGILRQHGELTEQSRSLSLKELLDLYKYARYFGDFRVASFLRTQTLLAFFRAQEGVPYVMPAMLAAAIENDCPELVLKTVLTKTTRAEDQVDVDEATAMAHALLGNISEATRLWSATFRPNDLSFLETIAGRTVAVVGPAPPVIDVRAEIDSFDLVIRTNYYGNANPQLGSRTDISYYNGPSLNSRRNEILASASHLKWLVASRGSDQVLQHLLPTHPGIRSAENPLSLFLLANPLGIPTILSDLVRFSPARTKLFCTNFFASHNLYTKEYRPTPVGANTVSHSLRIHDPFSSFSLVQLLHKAGLCEVDEIAGEVLNLTREEYANNLQLLYGGHTVANEKPQ